MGRKTNYVNNVYSDLEQCHIEIDELKKKLRSAELEISLLKDENNRLRLESEKNKIINDKDCTCSSIPSSKCNFKTGISNSRKKTTRKPGAVSGHKGSFLSTKKIEELKANPKTKIVTRKINCNSNNKNQDSIIRYMLRYEIIPVIYEYKIYPNEKGKYDLPKEFHSQIQYSKDLKSLAMDLYYNRNVSTDNIRSFLSDLFGIKFCKGTIVNWEKELESKLMPETRNILTELMKEEYNHVDEAQVNINGETFNIHNVSSNKYTMQWIHKNKNHAAIEEIGFLTEYKETLIKVGTHLYDKYAT